MRNCEINRPLELPRTTLELLVESTPSLAFIVSSRTLRAYIELILLLILMLLLVVIARRDGAAEKFVAHFKRLRQDSRAWPRSRVVVQELRHCGSPSRPGFGLNGLALAVPLDNQLVSPRLVKRLVLPVAPKSVS